MSAPVRRAVGRSWRRPTSTALTTAPHPRRTGRTTSPAVCDVLVAAAAEVDQDDRVGSELAAELQRAGEGVRGLDGRDDALGAAEQAQRLHRLGVGGREVGRPADVGEVRVLGADARVVEPGRDRVRLDGLAVLVLQQVAARAVQDAGAAALDRCRVALGVDAVAGGLVAVELHVGVVEEGVEDADRVRSAADAGRHGIRKPAGQLEHLRARLFADDLLEVAHHRRERVRAGGGAEDVVGGLDARDPLAVGLVDRVFQGARAGGHRDDLGAEQAHAGDVERLALRCRPRP